MLIIFINVDILPNHCSHESPASSSTRPTCFSPPAHHLKSPQKEMKAPCVSLDPLRTTFHAKEV